MKRRPLRDRAFQTYWRFQRPLTLGVRGVVVNAEGGVLLLRHTYTPGWHFPGGGVERGETAELSIKRELQEEAGVELTGPPSLLSIHSNHASFPGDHVLIFRIPLWSQGVRENSTEIAETGFFDPRSPPEGTTGGTRRRLDEIFGGAALSPNW